MARSKSATARSCWRICSWTPPRSKRAPAKSGSISIALSKSAIACEVVPGEEGGSPPEKRNYVLRKDTDRLIELGDGATVGSHGDVYSRRAAKIVAVFGNLCG